MGSRSSVLVDEHEALFKKNPRRVVRPAGESHVERGEALVWVHEVWAAPRGDGAAGLC